MTYILAIDQGTTGTTAVLINSKDMSFVDKINEEYPQIFPRPSWVEHNLNDIWKSIESTVSKLIKKNNISVNNIDCIGITNQRETTCAFDKKGTPLENAIVWQDRRTFDKCQELIKGNHQETFKKKTGLPLDAYFSGTKMWWLNNNSEKVKKAQKENNLLFGTIDTFILYKLTNGESYFTEASNASRTLLMNLETAQWDRELLDILEIKIETLPQIKDSFGEFGRTKGLKFLPDGIPITGILGDQQSALFGQAGINKGDMKCTYGTGAFLLLNTGETLQYSHSGLLTTVAFKHNNKISYAIEGSCYIAGAAVQWLRDNLDLIKKSSDIEPLALKVENLIEMENILLFPFFTGIGSPYWKSDAKAAIIGLTRDTGKPHLARAALEGIAFSINDLVTAMKKDTGLTLSSLKIDGGAAENNLLLTIQASISKLEIIRPKIIETTAYGAAMAAAIGNNQLKMEELNKYWQKDKSFSAHSDWEEYYSKKLSQWNKTIEKLYLN